MNTAREKHFWLKVRFGGCQRSTDTDGKNSQRRIMLRDCPVLSNSLKGEKELTASDEIELWIYETDQGQEAIGTIDTFAIIELMLPPAAFAEFWAASASVVGATYDVIIQFQNEGSSSYTITKAQLDEHLPETVDYYPKAHAPGYIPGRVHPVVAELRDMQRRFIGGWRGFLITAVFFLGIFILIEILQAVWRVLQP
jgi:hypothetical protein